MKSLKFSSSSFSLILIFLFISCFFLLSVGTSWASSPSSTSSSSLSDVDTTSCGDEFTTVIKFCPAGSYPSSSSSSSLSSAIKVGETLLFNGIPQAMKVKEIKMGLLATNASNGNSTTPPRETYQDMRYLITVHAGLMFFAFGILLPIGGFLATNKHLTYHKWFQISGLICAGISYVFAFYFAQINGGHFKFSHGYLGVILLLMALIGQPLFVYLGHYKRRGGSSSSFPFSALCSFLYLLAILTPSCF
jgi:hypothetical protein